MKSIYKYSLKTGINKFSLPYKAEFLSFGLDGNHQLSMWYLIDLDEGLTIPKIFYVVATGQELTSENYYQSNFLGTTTQGSFVWHLFRD